MDDVADKSGWDRGIRIVDFKAGLFSIAVLIIGFLLIWSTSYVFPIVKR